MGAMTKLAIGYFLGAIVFAIPLAFIFVFGLEEIYFSLAALVTFVLFFVVMLTKRISLQQTDPIIQKPAKTKRTAPIPSEEVVERNVPKKMVFESGLMVKSKDGKKQVFKEKEDTILNALEKKTNEIQSKTAQAEKNAALEKLRQSAQQINKKPIKKKSELEEAEDMDEIEEGLLEDMSKTEEEY
jgi:hypothetical protein